MSNSSKSSTAQEAQPTMEMEGKQSLLGFRMPAGWEPLAGCWMGWPERPDSWRESAVHAQKVFAKVSTAISNYMPVTVCASAAQILDMERVPRFPPNMILEGGSIHVDGQGTCIATEECLLNPNHNPYND